VECTRGWCGAPFCSPECKPDTGEIEKRESNDAEADKKNRPGWCGAQFCFPKCKPPEVKREEVFEKLHIRQIPDEAEAECMRSWYGAPFGSPERKPGIGEVEKRQMVQIPGGAEADKTNCVQDWCGAPFCLPK
jgi:hypothetical protein